MIGIALVVDLSRVTISLRASAEYKSAALRSNAFHFAGDMAGSVAVLFGILAVALGFQQGDAIASLVVAAIIFTAAARLIYENARVLMDTTPAEAQAEAEAAIRGLGDDIELRQLRLRESGGHYFADATIGAAPDQALVASHRAADRVEAAVRRALPDADVVVHVEPLREGLDLRARALAIALAEPPVQEAHDIAIYRHGETLQRLDAPEARRGDAARRGPRGRRADRGGAAARLGGRRRADPPRAAGGADGRAHRPRDAAAGRIAALVEERTGAPAAPAPAAGDRTSGWSSSSTSSPPRRNARGGARHGAPARAATSAADRPEGSARIVDVVVHTEP